MSIITNRDDRWAPIHTVQCDGCQSHDDDEFALKSEASAHADAAGWVALYGRHYCPECVAASGYADALEVLG